MNTGEDIHGLRKIADFTRLLSIAILALHFYMVCYPSFQLWGWSSEITNQIAGHLVKTGLFSNYLKPKVAALLLLMIFLISIKGKKEEKIKQSHITLFILSGVLLYFSSTYLLYISMPIPAKAMIYMSLSGIGYLFILTGGTWLSRLLKNGLQDDIFNLENETFPQEERLLNNAYSINLPARYQLKKKIRKSWINIINPFKGVLVAGKPGTGKSAFIFRNVIDQHIKKGFSVFLYDMKYDDLSRIAYNKLLQYRHGLKKPPGFFVINFDDLSRTHRCNPLDPGSMQDISDASESSRTILMGLNREWIKRQGAFFVESPINFLTAIIWYLRKYQDGKYCTLPHVIELMQIDYELLFPILDLQEEIKVLINPFISAFKNKASEQLEGQVASAKIGLARLSSPQLYWVMSGNDFTLDINNPKEPKIVCMGNNPQKLQTYGAVLSLYVHRLLKIINQKGGVKSSLILDEFPTLFINGISNHLAVARGYKCATILGMQDLSQNIKDYGREEADAIFGVVGNVISGQVSGNTAKHLSEQFGRIQQEKVSHTRSSGEPSITRSSQLEYAVPISKISRLSSGEFVGVVADDPDCKIDLKMFHAEIQHDFKAMAKEASTYQEIPLINPISREDVQRNYEQIKNDVRNIVRNELKKIEVLKTPETSREHPSGRNIKPPVSM